jgi:hypothetical protein
LIDVNELKRLIFELKDRMELASKELVSHLDNIDITSGISYLGSLTMIINLASGNTFNNKGRNSITQLSLAPIYPLSQLYAIFC